MLRGHSIVLLALALGGCTTVSDEQTFNLATAQLADPDGKPVGTAIVVRRGGQVIASVKINGLPGSVHGLHLHAIGKCEAPFTSAGPHLNPAGQQHGKDNPMGAHLGDLPNVIIDKTGQGSVTATLGTDWAAISAVLHDADGTAIVLHAAADDYRTDPTGNSGARIACGVLKRA